MRQIRPFMFSAAFLLFFSACDKNPAGRLTDPMPEGTAPGQGAAWTLYDDELRTGGGVYFFPESDNQSLSLESRDASAAGAQSIFYSWNGGPVPTPTEPNQHLFAGFGLLVADQIDDIDNVPPRDLSSIGYTKITFQAMGHLSENTVLRIEGPSYATEGTLAARLEVAPSQLSSAWTTFTLSPINPTDFKGVRQYVSFAFIYTQPSATTNPGEGGHVYIDNIKYEK